MIEWLSAGQSRLTEGIMDTQGIVIDKYNDLNSNLGKEAGKTRAAIQDLGTGLKTSINDLH